MRRPNDEEWTHLVEDGDVEGREEWMDGVSAVFNYFAERTPGSYIEKQAMTVVGTGRLLRMVFCCFFFISFPMGLVIGQCQSSPGSVSKWRGMDSA